MITDLQEIGIHELTVVEQRGIVGGGFFESAGRLAGKFVGMIVNAAEALGEAYMEWAEVQISGNGLNR